MKSGMIFLLGAVAGATLLLALRPAKTYLMVVDRHTKMVMEVQVVDSAEALPFISEKIMQYKARDRETLQRVIEEHQSE